MATSVSPQQVNLLYAARTARGFADGFSVIILPAYLTELGFSAIEVGLVATAALLGSACATLVVGLISPRYDLRTLLLFGAVLVIGTGLALVYFKSPVWILLIAFLGTLNPSTSDVGLLVPLEHTMLARSAGNENRTSVFARYSLAGALATAAGALAAALPDYLVTGGIDRLLALKAMFFLYAAAGVVAAGLYWYLPRTRLQKESEPQSALGPSRGIVVRLAALFSVDAFAGGFIVQSLLALWLFEKFELSLTAASIFFFWSNVLTAFSYPVAARLAKRFGLINTMVFTHIPSSVCLILAAFAPNIFVVLGLLLIRSALSQMDVPTRTSYVMAVVTPAEQPAAASFTSVPRSLASSLSPAMAGALLGSSFPGLPLVLCGALKISYDIALLFTFRNVKPPEERTHA